MISRAAVSLCRFGSRRRVLTRRLATSTCARGRLAGEAERSLNATLLRCVAAASLTMRLLGLADQLVRFVLRHLAATNHVLHEVSRALDGETGDACGGADDILHGGRDLRPRFLADQLRALGHLGHRVSCVGGASTNAARTRGTRAGSAARRPRGAGEATVAADGCDAGGTGARMEETACPP